jgi:hypothetical protein
MPPREWAAAHRASTQCKRIDFQQSPPASVGQRFLELCDGFPSHFRLRTRDVAATGPRYLSSLMEARR